MSPITKENDKPKKYTRSVKCPECNISFDRNKEPFQYHSNRYWHQACYEEQQGRVHVRQQLYDYICELHEIDMPTGHMMKQIKEFEDERNYSLRGMLTTLRYAHEILELPVLKGTGVGIIEVYYSRALEHYTKLVEAQKENAKIKYDNTAKTVYTKPPKARQRKNIDIGGL